MVQITPRQAYMHGIQPLTPGPRCPQCSRSAGVGRAGDCNNDNTVSVADFNLLKGTFGKSAGDPGYDARADFNRDLSVNISDFNNQKNNFGQSGALLTCP